MAEVNPAQITLRTLQDAYGDRFTIAEVEHLWIAVSSDLRPGKTVLLYGESPAELYHALRVLTTTGKPALE